MTPLILLGAGKIGETIAQFLHGSGDYELTVADQDPARLVPIAELGVKTTRADFGDARALAALIGGNAMVISACPYYLTPAIAQAAVAAGAHYFDLTEDVESTRRVKAPVMTLRLGRPVAGCRKAREELSRSPFLWFTCQ